MGDGIREILEAALMQCTTLTEGDVIKVHVPSAPLPETSAAAQASEHAPAAAAAGGAAEPMQVDSSEDGAGSASAAAGGGGVASSSVPSVVFQLLVQELRPSNAVSLIDTDIEAQVVPSLETEQVGGAGLKERERSCVCVSDGWSVPDAPGAPH